MSRRCINNFFHILGFGNTLPTKQDKIENQTEISSQDNCVNESLEIQKANKIRINTICDMKTTSDRGTVTLLQNLHNFFSV